MKAGRAATPRRWALAAAGCAALFAVLAALVSAGGAPFPLDRAPHLWSVAHRPPVAVAFARAVTVTGSGPVPYLCALGAGLLAGRGTRGRWLSAAGALGFLLVAQGVRTAVMYAVARPRPPLADWTAHASGYAFPSGHTTTSALAAGLLAGAAWRTAGPATARLCWVLLACWALAVGLSRIYLGVHWPTDVLGGWLFAATWLAAATALATRKYRAPS
ncbi:phosphatase PAP2 family protein [Streptomyces sp. NPDC087917]|uniref:phosphatase PAP2 family protein n=1 Tax=unclassified Streptomyces TaxID=2593676 RepID=UPI0034253B42